MYSKDRGAYPATGCARAVTRRAGAAVRARTGAPRTAERVEAMDCIVRTRVCRRKCDTRRSKISLCPRGGALRFRRLLTRARPGSRQLHLLSSWQRAGVNTTPPGCSSTSAAQVQSAGFTPPPAPTPKQSSTLSLLLSPPSNNLLTCSARRRCPAHPPGACTRARQPDWGCAPLAAGSSRSQLLRTPRRPHPRTPRPAQPPPPPPAASSDRTPP